VTTGAAANRAEGLPDELVVSDARPFQSRFLVSFEGLVGREAADRLRGAVLLAEPVEEPGVWFVHELIGAEVFDQTGARRGSVTAVEANPASDLLVVDDRAYVPMTFVVGFSERRVDVEVPEGLFE